MKIRINYVSNSSSSSFCIFGIVVDRDEYNEFEEGEELCSYSGIDNYSENDVIIGLRPYEMKDNETLAEFRDRVAALLNKQGYEFKPKDIDWHIDGGPDY